MVNNMLHNIEENNPDIIITGTQAETVAASIACAKNIPREQSYFLYGVNPDGFVLICNYFDDVDYVVRTIKCAEAINGAQVIAVVIFPVDNDLRWSVLGNKQLVVNEQELADKKSKLQILVIKKYTFSQTKEICRNYLKKSKPIFKNKNIHTAC